jgi:hypothetical protein
MEELNNIDINKCQGCQKKKKKLFSRFSDCSLCGKLYLAKPFCNNCCIPVKYKLSDYLLFKKYCFVCYFAIESSKQSLEPAEEDKKHHEDMKVCIDSEDSEELQGSLVLPTQEEVILFS